MEAASLQIALALLAAAIALTAAFLVARSSATPIGRRLAIVLAFEGLFSISFTLGEGTAVYDAAPRLVNAIGTALVLGLSASYLSFLAQLESPLVRALRRRWLEAVYVAMPLGGFALSYAWWSPDVEETAAESALGALVGLLLLVVAIGGLVVAISAVRASRRGSATRARALVFAVAFGVRDAAWAGFLVALVLHQVITGSTGNEWFFATGPPLITMVYVPIIAYGMLRHQLFDIDLKLKVGIRRSTVVTAILIVALAAAKVAEFYLNRTFGWIAGGIAAGVMLVLTPRLNKMGEKVASTAMPKVEHTSAYVEFRKLEVYKAALESALETGELSEKERETLRRLRGKLGITDADAAALEGDVRERMAAPAA